MHPATGGGANLEHEVHVKHAVVEELPQEAEVQQPPLGGQGPRLAGRVRLHAVPGGPPGGRAGWKTLRDPRQDGMSPSLSDNLAVGKKLCNLCFAFLLCV